MADETTVIASDGLPARNHELERLDVEVVGPAGLVAQDGLQVALRLGLGRPGRNRAGERVKVSQLRLLENRPERRWRRVSLPVWRGCAFSASGALHALLPKEQ